MVSFTKPIISKKYNNNQTFKNCDDVIKKIKNVILQISDDVMIFFLFFMFFCKILLL